MMKPAHLRFRNMPSLFHNLFYIAAVALWRKRRVRRNLTSIPEVVVNLQRHRISPKHHHAFNTMCAIAPDVPISPIYPMTLVFPFFQRMLVIKQAPLPVFNALGKHLHIQQHQSVVMDRSYDIVCRYGRGDIVSKGFEFDMSAVIEHQGNPVWEAVSTIYYRGDYGPATKSDGNNKFQPIPDAAKIGRWPLPGGKGFRFARISGDGNPSHFAAFYARKLGFERDFAQPFLVLGNAVNRIAHDGQEASLSLDVSFKGPLYYERDVIMKGASHFGRHRFDLYSEGNPRPCMSGLLQPDK